jgi:transcription initiation factor IIE alpha subunit
VTVCDVTKYQVRLVLDSLTDVSEIREHIKLYILRRSGSPRVSVKSQCEREGRRACGGPFLFLDIIGCAGIHVHEEQLPKACQSL